MQNTGVPSLINSVFHFLNIRKKNANTNNDHNAELLQKESQSQSQTQSEDRSDVQQQDMETDNDLLKQVMNDVNLNKMEGGGSGKKSSSNKDGRSLRKGKIIPKHIL